MRDTSIEAYRKIIESLPQKRLEVLAHIEMKGKYGATLFELVDHMKKPVNEISGRVTELSRAGLIEENGKRINPATGKRATVWIINREKAYEMGKQEVQ